MKNGTVFNELARALVVSFCIAAILRPPAVPACAGSRPFPCIITPGVCLKSISLGKSSPPGAVMGNVGFPGGNVSVDFTVFATCPTVNNCGTSCPTSAIPTGAMLALKFYPAPLDAMGNALPCPAAPPAGAPAFSYSVATPDIVLPACTSAGAMTTYTVAAPVPTTTPLGVYCAYGTATVTFSDGMTLTASGDTVVCVVAPVPGRPGVPRLSITLLSPASPRMAPGDQAVVRYRVVNNDPSNSVQLTAFANSRQTAVRPQGGNEVQGVFAISNPFGDDFPILFNPGTNCVPLPSHPYTQAEISNTFPVIGPGQSNLVTVGIRSYGQCASGSCSESLLRVTGAFSDGTPAFACASMALMVDSSLPSQSCGALVNDCNHNGIPDAVDIANRVSQDRNFNALPDECEQSISVPVANSVNPTNPAPGAPIQVQVAFNETVPMSNVWANGSSMTRMTIGGVPFWQGTIPADTRPGPQTVYFLGKDNRGSLATYIATYQVLPAPTVVTFQPGYSTIADNYVRSTNNRLSVVLPNPADGTQIYKWNSTSQNYVVSTYDLGAWDLDATLAPGEGAFIYSPVAQFFTFSGQTAPAPVMPRPPPGRYLVGCRAPQPCGFEELMGFPPAVGDQVYKYDTVTPGLPNQPSSTSQFTTSGWSPSPPVLGVAKAAFVQLAAPPPPPPVIISFSPHEGGEGTILKVNGSGFHGGQPDDHCLVLTAGNRFIDVEVLTATPTQLVARIGVIPPAYTGQPLQLMLGGGEGGRVDLCPAFHDVTTTADNWRWAGLAANTTTAPGAFFAVAGLPPANPPGTAAPANFHSGGPAGGALTVTLNKDWGIGSRFCISARVHAQGTGNDTRLTGITFTGAGNRFDCASRICDLLVKAFATPPPGMNPLNITCAVTTNGTNAVITIRLANGTNIDGGNLDIIQKAPPPVIAGLWDIQNAGLWRKEIRKHELARWYRHYEWVTRDTIWFERRAEGLWITKQALESFTCRSHCLYRFPDGRIWIIWRTFSRADVIRFWVHYRFWWPGRLNPLLPVTDTRANRTMMSMDDAQIVLPMTPADPNPSTPVNEAVMIIDENGVQHFQGEPGFEIPPDIAGNPNGFQLATTAESTVDLPPAADRIRDIPMQPMPGMANLQPGVIIQWLVDKNGNVLVDHDTNGWPDRLTDPHVLGAQKHQGLIAPPTGVAGTALPVDQGNNQLQLFCWELDPTGEVRGASPGQVVIGPPVDLNGDGVADGPVGGPIPADPTVRELVVNGSQVQEQRDPTAKPVDVAVVEEAAPTDAQLAAMNANLAAQIPGFVPLQKPFVLCINRIWVRRIWSIDRRFVFDTWLHHWAWQHRNHIVLIHNACRVWLTKVSLSQFSFSQHCFPFGLPATWRMFSLTDVRFFRVCFRVVVVGPNQVAIKIDQMHVTVPSDPANPNSPLMLLSTRGDENALFQEVPAPVLAGLQPDPLPVGPDGVFVEPIDPVADTLDIGLGGTGVFGNRPLEARGMLPDTLAGNDDAASAPANNQLQLYCWALNPNGTIAQETFTVGAAAQAAGAPPGVITLAMTPTLAMPSFEDDAGNRMDNPTLFITTLASDDNKVNLVMNGKGTATLSWDGPGQLQAAAQLLTSQTVWTNVSGGALSPVTVNINQMKSFYRLRR